MNNTLKVMWISFFWFLMPWVGVTPSSGRSPDRREGQSGGSGPSSGRRSRGVLGPGATVASGKSEIRRQPPDATRQATSDRTPLV